MNDTKQFFGKFEGTVINNFDPMGRNRLQVLVPAVKGLAPCSWVEASSILTSPGTSMGMSIVPHIGTGVWIEFVQGDIGRPVWTGCRWGANTEIPVQARGGVPHSPNIVLQSITQQGFIISDLPGPNGGIKIQSSTGQTFIQITDSSITLNVGGPLGTEIKMSHTKVSINGNNLVIEK